MGLCDEDVFSGVWYCESFAFIVIVLSILLHNIHVVDTCNDNPVANSVNGLIPIKATE